jgi:hypothetical protein
MPMCWVIEQIIPEAATGYPQTIDGISPLILYLVAVIRSKSRVSGHRLCQRCLSPHMLGSFSDAADNDSELTD